MPETHPTEPGDPAPRGVQRADLAAPFDEALRVEQAVRGQKHLAMDVTYEWQGLAERNVHHAVVELVAPDLVEADAHVDRNVCAVRTVQVSGEPACRDGMLAHAA